MIQDGLSTNVSMFIRSVVFLLTAFIFLFYISWQLTLATIAAILPVIAYALIYGRKMRSLQKAIQDNKAIISTIAEESFANIRTVKAFANEIDESKRFLKGNLGVYKQGLIKSTYYGGFQFISTFFTYGSMCLIIYVSSVQYKHGDITIGDVSTFLLYMIQLLMNFMMLSAVLGSVMAVVGASHKIVKIMEY